MEMGVIGSPTASCRIETSACRGVTLQALLMHGECHSVILNTSLIESQKSACQRAGESSGRKIPAVRLAPDNRMTWHYSHQE